MSRASWNWKASVFVIVMWLIWAVGLGFLLYSTAHAQAQIPMEAQASNMAVPEPKHIEVVHGPFPFVSGVVVSECHIAKAVLLVDKDGGIHEQHLQDMTYPKLIEMLQAAAPADKIIEVTLVCPDAKSI